MVDILRAWMSRVDLKRFFWIDSSWPLPVTDFYVYFQSRLGCEALLLSIHTSLTVELWTTWLTLLCLNHIHSAASLFHDPRTVAQQFWRLLLLWKMPLPEFAAERTPKVILHGHGNRYSSYAFNSLPWFQIGVVKLEVCFSYESPDVSQSLVGLSSDAVATHRKLHPWTMVARPSGISNLKSCTGFRVLKSTVTKFSPPSASDRQMVTVHALSRPPSNWSRHCVFSYVTRPNSKVCSWSLAANFKFLYTPGSPSHSSGIRLKR